MMETKGTVIWVDPHMEWRSPTMKNMLAALPFLLDMGWKIEFLCFRSDPVDHRVRVRKLPCPAYLGALDGWWFRFLLCIDSIAPRHQRGALVHDTGALHPRAKIHSVHFDNGSWLKFQMKLSPKSPKDFARLALTAVGAVWESVFFRFARRGHFLPVSRSMAKLLAPKIPASAQLEVLPNVLDSGRFHPSVREQWRDVMRQELAINPSEKVFVFASTGHYLRKGFWEAVEALTQCRTAGLTEIRFLVIGAGPMAIAELTPRLNRSYPGWDQWIIWVAPTQQIEKYYAAGDAFLFPSRFESFALVALEASACGLPLLVTEYPGVEMYFQDGVNGRLLSWDVRQMAQQIQDFLRSSGAPHPCGPTANTNAEEYATILDRVYTGALQGQ